MNRLLGLKVSLGYDSHRIAKDRRLILGGVEIPGEAGLAGHSDADVLCHAVTDALAASSGLGDIGRMFPEDDPEYEGADSLKLLERTCRVAKDMGYRVINCDCTLIAEKPRIAGFADIMARNIASALGLDEGSVSVKGKTNEGMDSVGRGDGMAAYAVMLVIKD